LSVWEGGMLTLQLRDYTVNALTVLLPPALLVLAMTWLTALRSHKL
jgi:hypothetical protein